MQNRNSMQKNDHPISAVVLGKNLQGQGQHVYTIPEDGYMTLYMCRIHGEEVEPAADNKNTRAVMYIGHRGVSHGINPRSGQVIINFPVWQWEEVWMGIHTENEYVVYGTVTSTPLAVNSA